MKPVSGQLSNDRAGGGRRVAWSSVSCRLSAHRHSLLGHPFPLRSWSFLTVGLPARHQARVGPQRGFHVPHERATTGAGAPFTPRTTVLTQLECRPPVGVCRFTAASPWTPLKRPIGRASRNEASSRIHCCSPFRSSPCLWPLDGTAPLGHDHLSFAPRRCQRRTSGWGQAIEHRPGLHLRHRRPPVCVSTQLVRPRVAPVTVTSCGGRLVALQALRSRSRGCDLAAVRRHTRSFEEVLDEVTASPWRQRLQVGAASGP